MSWKCFVFPERPIIARDTLRNELHWQRHKEHAYQMILCSELLKYLSDWCFLLLRVIILLSMREISCPRTDCPKKYVLLSMVILYFCQLKITKEVMRMLLHGKSSHFTFLLDNSDYKP